MVPARCQTSEIKTVAAGSNDAHRDHNPRRRAGGRRYASLAALAVLLAACQPGGSGPLLPVAGPGMLVVAAEKGPPFARVASGSVTADVTGSWYEVGSMAMVVTYTNIGEADAAVSPGRFALRRGDDRLEMLSIIDSTQVDYAEGRPGAEYTVSLYHYRERPMVESFVVPAGETRRIELQIDNVQQGEPMGVDQSFHFDAALPDMTVPITFRSGRWG